MDETIYTIAINDAFEAASACPFCQLEQAYEKELLKYYLGPALMEPAVRMKSNASGFCKTHFYKLAHSGLNSLGLALMLQSHLDMRKLLLRGQLRDLSQNSVKTRFTRSKRIKTDAIREALHNDKSCLCCASLQERMNHYYNSVLHMYEKDENFKQRFRNLKELCIPHAAELSVTAAVKLKENERSKLEESIAEVLEKQIKKLEDDLQWFVNKHDYRKLDAPWGDSREAIIKTISLLQGEESE